MTGLDHIRQWLGGGLVTMASLTLGMGTFTSAIAAELAPEDTYAAQGLYSQGNNVSDINDLGIVSGRANVDARSDYFPHAGIWDETGHFIDLDPNFLNDSSYAAGINNHGVAVGTFGGFADQLRGPVLFSNGTIIPLQDINGVEDPYGRAQDINDNGLIVGCTNDIPVVWNDSYVARPIAGTPDGATGCAMAANDLGDIAGYVVLNGSTHATLWRNGQMIDLGTLAGHERSIAFGINERSQVVGFSQDIDGSLGNQQHPFLWDNGSMTDLGTLSGHFGVARDINDQGHIVGSAPGPFLYRDGVMYDLKPVATQLSSAVAINNNGQIAGNSLVLTPAPNQLDMTVTLSAPTGPIDSGTEYNYDIKVINRSTIDGHDIRLENSLSNELSVVSVISDQGTCSTSIPVVCDLGTIVAQTSVNIVLTVKADVPYSTSGNLAYASNYARVSSSNTDVNGANNSAYQSTTVTPPAEPDGADISVSLSDSPDPVQRGDDLTYTATVVNRGPLTAVNAQFSQTFNTRFKLRSVITTHGDCSAKSTIECGLGDLAPDETATITIVIRPQVPRGLSFFSTATITSDSPDPALYNNTASVRTSVQ